MVNYQKLKEDFKRLIDGDKLSHAYLFFGESQAGKFDFALSLANYLEKQKVLEECFIIAPDEKGTIGIDAVKKINNFLYQKPVFSKKRTAIIRDAENMTPEAQNAVLKIVEEPPQDALIIFIVKNEDSLLPPLVSRLQKIYFPRIAPFKASNSQILKMGLEEIIENDKLDEYFESLIVELRKDPVKNVERLQETLKRLTYIKMFNVNKKLQLRCLF